jgi:hypothetical protein
MPKRYAARRSKNVQVPGEEKLMWVLSLRCQRTRIDEIAKRGPNVLA